MNDEVSEISISDLNHVTGGGAKAKVAKRVWEVVKWTGIPAGIGGGAAWLKRQIMGPE